VGSAPVFTARQIQVKCREQNQDLYVVFVDLTKAFDTVNRDGLWHVLKKLGCPEKFVNAVKSLHDGMEARVLDQGSFSATFNVSNGVKQGLLSTGIDLATWEDLAGNRSKRQKACLTGVQYFEEVRIATAVEKRSRRKGSTSQSVPAAESTDTRPCGRQFTARIGLVGHTRIHRKFSDTGAHTSFRRETPSSSHLFQ